jgi:hypothetical protein
MAGNLPQQQPSPFVKSFTCRNCGAAVIIRNTRDSIVVICKSCNATIDLTDPNYTILAKTKGQVHLSPFIPLGGRGRLKDVLWEAIGYVRRMDVESSFAWDEFLLFNPYHGYRWLTQSKGHWNFVTPIKGCPAACDGLNIMHGNTWTYQGKYYKLYYSGQARVSAVLGEFYWRVQVNDTVKMEDYICPPYLLSMEKDQLEQHWSLSEYLEPHLIQDAFNLKQNFPTPMGVAPNQPSAPAEQWERIQKHALVVFGLLILLQMVHTRLSSNEMVLVHPDSYPGQHKTVVTQPFRLREGLGNALIQFQAPVNNTWLSVDGDLVNETTGESFPFGETVEHYQGYDGGEYWQEGDSSQAKLYSALPGGTYHLEYELSGARTSDVTRYVNTTPGMNYRIEVKRNVPMWSNFWWTFFLLLIYPLWCMYRVHSFETSRWVDSDYSPYRGDE